MKIPRLRELRELEGWTQKDLARKSGVSARSIYGYEAGAGVRPNTARKLAAALGVPVRDLVGDGKTLKQGTPPPEPAPSEHVLAADPGSGGLGFDAGEVLGRIRAGHTTSTPNEATLRAAAAAVDTTPFQAALRAAVAQWQEAQQRRLEWLEEYLEMMRQELAEEADADELRARREAMAARLEAEAARLRETA
jgi:transcriptional regulator with XRE-family HTH domain